MKVSDNLLDKEFNFYLDNQDSLVEKYNGKYLVIKGEKVIGIYDDAAAAYFETEKIHALGTFLIQLCESGDRAYTQTFHSVLFL